MSQTAVEAQLRSLRRIRWAVRATLAFGVAASTTANVLHADPNPISQVIAAWPPVALLLTVELTSRIPMHRPLLAVVRIFATVVIACIAAWVSYWHMSGVAARFGETEYYAQYLLPISVDGLIVVASVSLVELAGRIRLFEGTEIAPVVEASAPAVPRGGDGAELAIQLPTLPAGGNGFGRKPKSPLTDRELVIPDPLKD
jgi:hypothetical protein